jgi:hypothetical protein
MTVTKDQAQMIATLACASRPTGARQWKHDEVMAEIAKISGRSLPAVICAVTRAAMDRGAQRPAVISSAGSHWGDTMLATDWVPNAVPRESRCSICSLSEPACRIRWAADHDFKSAAIAAKEASEVDPEAIRAAVTAIREGIEPTKEPRPVKTLDELAEENPSLHAKVEAVRANMPKAAPTQEPTQAPEAADEGGEVAG